MLRSALVWLCVAAALSGRAVGFGPAAKWAGVGARGVRARLQMQGSATDLRVVTDKVLDAFAASTNTELTPAALEAWEGGAVEAASQLRQLSDSKALYAIYTNLLKAAAPKPLDPLQLATFEMLSGGIVDSLIRMFPKGVPVTGLIDEITDVHLSFVEEFRADIDDGGSDGYSQSTQQEFLCYQLAGLVERVYTRVSRGLGAEFDSSPAAVRMRISNWVSPVYARLQRRFVRFLAGNVEEKVEESNAAAFDRLLDKLVIGIEPKYHFTQLAASSAASSTPSSSSSSTSSPSSSPPYPAWELAFFVTKVLRNTLGCAALASVEPKIAQRLQNHMSVKMRALGRPLEQIATKMANKRFRLVATGQAAGFDEKEVAMMEAMLEIGHVSAAAVFTVWQARYNVVGVPEDAAAGYDGKLVKDYLSPVSLTSGRGNALLAVPKSLRVNAEAAVEEGERAGACGDELASAALLAHAVRTTAAEEFRALITYNSDPSEWPASRDASFSAVLSSVLLEALTEPLPSGSGSGSGSGGGGGGAPQSRVFLENLVAMAALEETIGVREPRSASVTAFETALKNAALLQLARSSQTGADATAAAAAFAFASRVSSVEAALGMMARLPDTSSAALRMSAFRSVVDALMSEAAPGETARALKRVEALSPQLAAMLGVDAQAASGYVAPLGRSVFDRSVGSLLVSVDFSGGARAGGAGSAAGGGGEQQSPEQAKMTQMLREQVSTLARDLGMDSAEAEERTGYLGGAVFESLLETALEEYRRLSVDRAEVAMLRAFALCRHPLLAGFGVGAGTGGAAAGRGDVVDVGVRMTLARLGAARLSEVMRMTEVLRDKQQGVDGGAAAAAGWGASSGGAAAKDAAYGAFLASLQEKLLREYSKSQMQRSLQR